MKSAIAEIRRAIAVGLLASVFILGYAFTECGTAQAQVPVQPQYVRPAKGGVITLINKEVLPAPGPKQSPLLDMTGFDALQVRVEAFNSATGASVSLASCSNVPQIEVKGAPTKTGAFLRETDEFAYLVVTQTRQTYTINNLSLFVRLDMALTDNQPIGATSCTHSIYATPFAFRAISPVRGPSSTGSSMGDGSGLALYPLLSGGVGIDPVDGFVYPYTNEIQPHFGGVSGVSGAVTVSSPRPVLTTTARVTVNSNTLVISPAIETHFIRIQNADTAPLVCRVGKTNTPAASTTNYNFALAAATAADNGTGGVIELDNATSTGGAGNNNIYCTKTGANPGGVVVLAY